MKRLTEKIHQFDKDGNIEAVKIIKDLNIDFYLINYNDI